jgi:hypothetical protein
MPQACKICNNSKRVEIDRELCRGKSKASIARSYNVSQNSLQYHADNHLSYQLKTAMQRKESIESMNLLSEIEDILSRTKKILDDAEARDRPRLALDAIREARGSYELLSKIAFSLHQARIQELELQQKQDGTKDEEDDREFWEGVHRNLNDAELHLLERLIEKINGETKENVVDGYRLPEELEYMQGIEQSSYKGKMPDYSDSPSRPRPIQAVMDRDFDDLDFNTTPTNPEPTSQPENTSQPRESKKDPRPECEKKMVRTKPPATKLQRALREEDGLHNLN